MPMLMTNSRNAPAVSLVQQPETQELKLEDLKHLRPETMSIPSSRSLSGKSSNGQEDFLDFSSITYQDVRQLIGPPDNITVYSEGVSGSSAGQQIIFPSSAASSRVASASTVTAIPTFTLQASSLTSPASSMPTFSQDVAYNDIAGLNPDAVYSVQGGIQSVVQSGFSSGHSSSFRGCEERKSKDSKWWS